MQPEGEDVGVGVGVDIFDRTGHGIINATYMCVYMYI